MRFNKRALEEDYSLQLAPLVDIVFLLLIFFMVSTAFVDFTRRIDIELPDVKSSAGITKERVYEIEMTKNGKLYLNGDGLTMQTLEARLKQKEPRTKKRVAIIRADKGLDHGSVMKIMGLLRSVEILDISIAVQ